MSALTIALVALGLAADAFAVAIAVGITLGGASPRQLFRLAFHFGLFQALMPVLGWTAGQTFGESVAAWDHWIAFGLLSVIGGKAIYQSRAGAAWRPRAKDPTRGLLLVTLAVATSLDALAVGVSLALIDVVIWTPVAVIGGVAAALTAVGLRLGPRLGAHFGQQAELVGGLILIAIGVKILIGDLL